MDVLKRLDAITGSKFVRLPRLSAFEIDRLAESLPCPMPGAMRDTLFVCRGISGKFDPDFLVDIVDFCGTTVGCGLPTLFPSGRGLAADGCGNHWVVDFQPDSTQWGPVYFLCHDPPVVLLQSPDVLHFVQELCRHLQPPHRSLLREVSEHRLCNVYRRDPGSVAYSDAMGADDAVMRTFAAEVGPGYRFTDLRNAAIGMGVRLELPYESSQRCGSLPVFAVPERKPKRSWLAR